MTPGAHEPGRASPATRGPADASESSARETGSASPASAPASSASAPHGPLPRIAHAIILIWAAGIILREPIAQLGCWLAVAFALFLVLRRAVAVPRELRPFLWSTVALCAWQGLSPAVALLTGASQHWPPSARYGQGFEPLGAAALAIVGLVSVPWVELAWTFAVGWLASTAAAAWQHFFGWHFDFPRWMKISTERVNEDFSTGGAPRFGAGGFQFHRLRFGHAGIALLGPAIAVLGRSRERRAQFVAAIGIAAILGGIWMTFARAAFGAALIVVAVGFVLFTSGWVRRAGLLIALACLVLPFASSAWRERFALASQNLLEGERMQAMTAGVRIWREHPLLGVGFGNHKEHALALMPELNMPEHITWDSHDLWITSMAEGGLLGVALFFAFHATLAVALFRRFRQGAWLSGGALLSLVGFHVLGLVHYLPFHSSVALTFYFVWGLGLVAPIQRVVEARAA